MLDHLLRKSIDRINLTTAETNQLMGHLCHDGISSIKAAAILASLHTKGETFHELLGIIQYLRAQSHRLLLAEHKMLDICGTGGDYKNTFNISTAAALLLASFGVTIAKHGGGAVSSKCGSYDVLQALGISPTKIDKLQSRLAENQFVFLNACDYNPSFLQIKKLRKQLGIRSVFNIVGPLVHPLRIQYQVIGVYARHLIAPVAKLLVELGVQEAMVVHSLDGLDELSTTSTNHIARISQGNIEERYLAPQECGLLPTSLANLRGGDASTNATIIKNIFKGSQSAAADVVLLNAAAALIVYGLVDTFIDGISLLKEHLASQKAYNYLSTISRGGYE